jgi:alkylation response protein AidB-like acyl-CoA dehydrogenase
MTSTATEAASSNFSLDRPLHDEPALRERLEQFLEPRAAAVDANEATLRDGLAFLGELELSSLGVYGRSDRGTLERMCEVTAAVAHHDMSQAFALWCHRMGVEYLEQARSESVRDELLPRVRSAEVIGSTSFAAATSHYLGGVRLPVQFRRDGDTLIANGRIAWASNVQAPFVSVTAAVNQDDPDDRVVFAYTEATPGFRTSPYPDLLALQSTNSTSPYFEDARIAPEWVLSEDFPDFFERVFATFILTQCSFCWGISERALSETEPVLTGPREVLREDLNGLLARYDSGVERLRRYARMEDRRALDVRDVLQLRLDWGRIAVDSVALELKAVGGRGYTKQSGTARRLREVMFLPVQSPTEVQLRWLLSR